MLVDVYQPVRKYACITYPDSTPTEDVIEPRHSGVASIPEPSLRLRFQTVGNDVRCIVKTISCSLYSRISLTL